MASDLKLSDQEKGQRTIDEFIRLVNADHDDVISMGRNQACYMRDEIERLRKRLAELEWQPITAENLPKVGDENGGWFGIFSPVWETRPFRWPLPSSSALKSEIIYEGLKLAGWTHFRPINPPAARVEGAEEGKNGHD